MKKLIAAAALSVLGGCSSYIPSPYDVDYQNYCYKAGVTLGNDEEAKRKATWYINQAQESSDFNQEFCTMVARSGFVDAKQDTIQGGIEWSEVGATAVKVVAVVATVAVVAAAASSPSNNTTYYQDDKPLVTLTTQRWVGKDWKVCNYSDGTTEVVGRMQVCPFK